jgi:DNA-binding NtrC family response regulator
MKKRIAVLDANQKECRRLCNLLEKNQYPTIPMHSIQYLETSLKQFDCLAVILDIDTISVDNRTIRDLTIRFPGVYFFCLSERPFHPELHDAICYHIFACINKPVDPDEIFYWLRSINENDRDSKDKVQA